MNVDELTLRRIKKLCDEAVHESLNNPEQNVSQFAGGMYLGYLKMLSLLDIEVENVNKFFNDKF